MPKVFMPIIRDRVLSGQFCGLLRVHESASKLPEARTFTVDGNLANVPRWRVLRSASQLEFERAVLRGSGVRGADELSAEAVAALPDATKLLALNWVASQTLRGLSAEEISAVARSGVIGLPALSPAEVSLDEMPSIVTLRGIVQQCGARGLMERLWLATQDVVDGSSPGLGVCNVMDDPTRLTVSFGSADSGRIARFLAMVRPTDGVPAVFHVVDLGWDLAPYNLMVWRIKTGQEEVLLGSHVYAVNIDEILPNA